MSDSFPKPQLAPAHSSASDTFKNVAIDTIVDTYDELLEDLFLIRNPRFKFAPSHEAEFIEWKASIEEGLRAGMWAYFPWSKVALHVLPEKEHLELRTARNRNLITSDEQEKFYAMRVAVAGLSVGSHAALTIALMGGAKEIYIADSDTISGSNLNRIRYDYTQIGKKKAHVAAEYIYQLNPYANVHVFDDGITSENVDRFLGDDHPIDLLVEELDSLEMKIRLRLAAREKRIPLVMATDNGDGIVVDIERYDLHENLPLFNGALGDISLADFQSFTPSDLPKLATKVAGPDLIVPKMLLSLAEVGKTLYSWPQLGDAATFSGVAIAYLARKIALKEPLVEGKIDINLDRIFDSQYDSEAATNAREAVRDGFKKAVGLS